MNQKEELEMIDSAQLLQKLTELDKRFKAQADQAKLQAEQARSQADDRHRVNGMLHGTLNSIVIKTDNQDQMLLHIQDSVTSMAESVRRVEVCLIGDEKFDRQGLIKDVLEIKAVNIALSTRISLAEDAAKANASELRNQRKSAMWAVGILAAIGGFVTWLKSIFSP